MNEPDRAQVKLPWWLLAALALACIVGIVGMSLNRRADALWQVMLSGPYAGFECTNAIPTDPDSSLPISNHDELEIYESQESGETMITLRSKGVVRWCRLLVIQEPSLLSPMTVLSNVQLQTVTSAGETLKVRFLADVGADRQEGGIIVLDGAGEFKGFLVSW